MGVRRIQETEMVDDYKETVSLGHSLPAAYMIKTVLPHTLYETLPLFGTMNKLLHYFKSASSLIPYQKQS